MYKCQESDIREVLEYIGEDYGKCLYLYIDLKKYGLTNDNISLWWQKENDNIKAIVLKYYTGMHIYSKTNEFSEIDVVNLIEQETPSMLCGMKDTIDKIVDKIRNYKQENGIVLQLIDYKNIFDPNVYAANFEELREIANMLSKDESLGKPYEGDLLYQQLSERYCEGFGRNYLLRDNDKKIISHVATYAELDNIAIVSGGFVAPEYRGQGQYANILGSMCKYLLDEGKSVFSYHYDAGQSAHKNVGFCKLGDWSKLVRI